MNDQAVAALHSGRDHVLFINPTLPDSALLDWPVRHDRMRRRGSIANALVGWEPLAWLDRVFGCASSAIISLDFVRPHCHGLVIVPRSVTPEILDRHWSLASGSAETGALWRRLRPVTGWESSVTRHELITTSAFIREEVREQQLNRLGRSVSNNVTGALSYILKGSDRPENRRLPESLPKAITSRRADQLIVYARGISIPASSKFNGLGTGRSVRVSGPVIELGEYIASRVSLSPVQSEVLRTACTAEARVRDRNCALCGKLLPVIGPPLCR